MKPVRIRGTLLAVGALALGPFLTACSVAEPSVSTSGDVVINSELPDPCGLLTLDQILTASETTVQHGTENAVVSNSTQRACDWKTADDRYPYVEVVIGADAGSISERRTAAERAMGASTDVTVPGGENAFSVANGGVLAMAVGEYFVQVAYVTGDKADVAIITATLAEDVAASI